MVVQAAWPGATRRRHAASRSPSGSSASCRRRRSSISCAATRAPASRPSSSISRAAPPPSEVPDIWYHVRKSVGDMRHTLPAGVVGPGFNDDFGDTFGIIYGFTADGFTHRELRDYVEDIRSQAAAACRTSRRSRSSARRTSGSSSSSRCSELAEPRHRPLRADRRAAGAERRSARPARSQTGDEKLSLRVSGAFRSEQDLLDVNFAVNGRLLRLRDIADGAARLLPIRRSRCSASMASRRSASPSPCATAATSSRSAGTSTRRWREVTADLPLGIDADPRRRSGGDGRKAPSASS